MFSEAQVELFLHRVVQHYGNHALAKDDPVQFAQTIQITEQEAEMRAWFSACYAYGNAKIFCSFLQKFFDWCNEEYGSTTNFVLTKNPRIPPEHFRYRFHSPIDLTGLAYIARILIEENGSLADSFFVQPKFHNEQNIGHALKSWLVMIRHKIPRSGYGTNFEHFFPNPERNSALKRWCLFLRWMGRRDPIDPGLWTSSSNLNIRSPLRLMPHQLLVPLDTHLGRISQALGWTPRSASHWPDVLIISDKLRQTFPDDPILADFALCRFGILEHSQNHERFDSKICNIMEATEWPPFDSLSFVHTD